MSKILLLLVALITLAPDSRAASGCGYSINTTSRPPNFVYFVNGIGNSITNACESSDALARAVASSGDDYGYFYNPTNLFTVGDIHELRAQAAMSEVAFQQAGVTTNAGIAQMSTRTKNTYYQTLGAMYAALSTTNDAGMLRIYSSSKRLKDILIDKASRYSRVIVVAHSQGNFYAEAAYAMLVSEARVDVIQRLRFVGVASVAATTPSNQYLTHGLDGMVLAAQNANSFGTTVYSPLPRTDEYGYIGKVSDFDIRSLSTNLFHSFNSIYLSDQYYSPSKGKSYRLIIRDFVQASLLSPAGPSAVGARRGTVSMTWNQSANNDGVQIGSGLSDPVLADINDRHQFFVFVTHLFGTAAVGTPPTGTISATYGDKSCSVSVAALASTGGVPNASASGALCDFGQPSAPSARSQIELTYSGDSNYRPSTWRAVLDLRLHGSRAFTQTSSVAANGAVSSQISLSRSASSPWVAWQELEPSSRINLVSTNCADYGRVIATVQLDSSNRANVAWQLSPRAINPDFRIDLTSDAAYYYSGSPRTNRDGGPGSETCRY